MFDGDYLIGPETRGSANFSPYRDWLAQLCLCVPHAREGYIRLSSPNDSGDDIEVLCHPENLRAESSLLAALAAVAETGESSLHYFNRGDEALCAVICAPTDINSGRTEQRNALHAVAVIFPKFDPQQLEALTRLIKNNFAWLDLIMQAEADSPATDFLSKKIANFGHGVSEDSPAMFDNWLAQSNALACAMAISADLANHFNCERVIVVRQRSANHQIYAISGAPNADPRQQCNHVCTELAAELAEYDDGIFSSLDQVHPQLNDLFKRYRLLTNTKDFTALSHTTSEASRYTVIFEWHEQQAKSAAAYSRAIISKTTRGLQVLSMKTAAQPRPLARIMSSGSTFFANCIGEGNLKSKLTLLAMITIAAITTLIPFEFKISAPITLEGATQRAIVTPFESYVRTAHVEAGMTVRAGQALVELDQSKLELEKDKWASEKAKLNREYDRALADLDHSQAQITRAQLGQADAELNLVNNKIARTVLYAPFDGLVISGNLSQSLGAPIARGDVLFEIAPLTGYRVVLSVDERDIANVLPKQAGALTLNSIPNKQWPFEVRSVASAAPSEDGERAFRVEAELAETSDQLRPGMQGIGKIHVGEESLAYILSRRFIGWLQLNLWSKLP